MWTTRAPGTDLEDEEEDEVSSQRSVGVAALVSEEAGGPNEVTSLRAESCLDAL